MDMSLSNKQVNRKNIYLLAYPKRTTPKVKKPLKIKTTHRNNVTWVIRGVYAIIQFSNIEMSCDKC